jgi:hypothetical protein
MIDDRCQNYHHHHHHHHHTIETQHAQSYRQVRHSFCRGDSQLSTHHAVDVRSACNSIKSERVGEADVLIVNKYTSFGRYSNFRGIRVSRQQTIFAYYDDPIIATPIQMGFSF